MTPLGYRCTADNKTYLACKGNRWLIQPFLLRISDIGRNDLIKGKPMAGLLELLAKRLCLDGELATHGILDFEESGIKGVDGKIAHWRRRGEWTAKTYRGK